MVIVMNVDEAKEQANKMADLEKYVCKDCKAKIVEKMKPIQKAYNAGGIKAKWANARMAAMTTTLWRDLCPACIRKLKQQVVKK